jgi:hypothetical protein
MKIIHCSLWGDIEVSDLALSVIDTPHFQRLHYIRQTGFSYKVFPGANTSRFEHSLGVYEVTRNLLSILIHRQPALRETLDERAQEIVCIAGLVHDLGHGPFSHLFDHYVSRELEPSPWTDHETRSILLLRDLVLRYGVALSEYELDTIESLVLGTHPPAWYATPRTAHGVAAGREGGLREARECARSDLARPPACTHCTRGPRQKSQSQRRCSRAAACRRSAGWRGRSRRGSWVCRTFAPTPTVSRNASAQRVDNDCARAQHVI